MERDLCRGRHATRSSFFTHHRRAREDSARTRHGRGRRVHAAARRGRGRRPRWCASRPPRPRRRRVVDPRATVVSKSFLPRRRRDPPPHPAASRRRAPRAPSSTGAIRQPDFPSASSAHAHARAHADGRSLIATCPTCAAQLMIPPGAPTVACGACGQGASQLTLVPIRPRRRGERRSLRTLPAASLRPPLAFNPRPRRLSTPLLTPFNSTPTFACNPASHLADRVRPGGRRREQPVRREGAAEEHGEVPAVRGDRGAAPGGVARDMRRVPPSHRHAGRRRRRRRREQRRRGRGRRRRGGVGGVDAWVAPRRGRERASAADSVPAVRDASAAAAGGAARRVRGVPTGDASSGGPVSASANATTRVFSISRSCVAEREERRAARRRRAEIGRLSTHDARRVLRVSTGSLRRGATRRRVRVVVHNLSVPPLSAASETNPSVFDSISSRARA